MNEGGDTPFSTLEIDMISKKPKEQHLQYAFTLISIFLEHRTQPSHLPAHFQQRLSMQCCWHPLLCRKYAHRMKDAQASGHYCQALGKCRLPRHTLPCYLFFKIEQIYAINANYNRLSTITQKVGEMKITLRQGFKPP